jgi:hypothetical protein
MLTKSRLVQLLIMMIVLVGLIIWRTVTNETLSDKKNNLKSDLQIEKMQITCDYEKPCEFNNEQGSFWLSVHKPPIKAEQWNDISITSNVREWQVLDAKLVGKEMFMGRIPVDFLEEQQGVFSAKVLVGACATEQMVWQLQINIEVNGVKDQLLFDFSVYR